MTESKNDTTTMAEAELDKANMQAYWDNHWDTNSTGWKAFESDTTFRQLFKLRLDLGGKKMKEMRSADLATTADTASSSQVIFTKENPLRVLVPLSGDSPILTYLISDEFVKDFPAMEGVPMEVVGIDLAAKAFSSIFQKSASAGETWGAFEKDSSAVPGLSAEVWSLTRSVGSVPKKLILIAGDYFAAAEAMVKNGMVFQASWDRAACVALPLELRLQFTQSVNSLLGLSSWADEDIRAEREGPFPFVFKGTFLETVNRPEGQRLVGPPFHISSSVNVVQNWDNTPAVTDNDTDKEKLLTLVVRKMAISKEILSDEVLELQKKSSGGAMPPFTFHAFVLIPTTVADSGERAGLI